MDLSTKHNFSLSIQGVYITLYTVAKQNRQKWVQHFFNIKFWRRISFHAQLWTHNFVIFLISNILITCNMVLLILITLAFSSSENRYKTRRDSWMIKSFIFLKWRPTNFRLCPAKQHAILWGAKVGCVMGAIAYHLRIASVLPSYFHSSSCHHH